MTIVIGTIIFAAMAWFYVQRRRTRKRSGGASA
jgi:hypothetical protein